MIPYTDLIEVPEHFKPAVQLPGDFENEETNAHFVQAYIPTEPILDIFEEIAGSLQSGSPQRARLFTGTFGTGKSDLMLMIANYMTRAADDPILEPFFRRLRQLDSARTDRIMAARRNKKPYLLVLEQADTTGFKGFVLYGLKRTLEQKQLGALMRQTAYQAALDVLQTWEGEHPEHVERMKALLEREGDITYDRLKQSLQGVDADQAMTRFRLLFERVTGVMFAETHALNRASDAFKDVAKAVKGHDYEGVFLIVDEFTHFFKQWKTDRSAVDTKTLDDLLNLAARPEQANFHFYVVSLEGFASAGSASQDVSDNIERSGGRFTDSHALKSSHTEEFIRSAIVKHVSAATLYQNAQHQKDELLDLAVLLWKRSERSEAQKQEWVRSVIVEGCFPLHPLATYCLPLLNNELAQNERTMFQYLSDNVYGLRRFIESHNHVPDPETRWYPLVSLDRLFDYFEEALRAKDKHANLAYVYDKAAGLLDEERFKAGLEGRLLRALIVLEILMGDSNLRPTTERLCQAISYPKAYAKIVETALHSLEEQNLAYRTEQGIWQLVLPGRANPRELRRKVAEAARKVATTETLSAYLNSYPFIIRNQAATGYNDERGSDRALKRQFVLPATLVSPKALIDMVASAKRGGLEGVVLYVIARDTDEINEAQARAMALANHEATRALASELVIAVPRQPTTLDEALYRYLAVKHVQQEETSGDADIKSLLSKMQRDAEKAVNDARDEFVQPARLRWFYQGDARTVTNLAALASDVMETLYPDTPYHEMGQHLKPGAIGKPVRDAIEEMLKDNIEIAPKGKSPKDAVLRKGAEKMGLITPVTASSNSTFDVYEVSAPRHATNLKAWHKLAYALRLKADWAQSIGGLKAAPVGLYDSVAALYVAAFFRMNQDALTIRRIERNNRVTESGLSTELIVNLVQSPERYEVLFEALPIEESRFLRALRSQVSAGRLNDAGALLPGAANAIREWFNRVGNNAQSVTVQDLVAFHPLQPRDILNVAIALKAIALESMRENQKALLTRTLPDALEMPTESKEWDAERVIKPAMETIERAMEVWQGNSDQVRIYLAKRVHTLFGGSGQISVVDDSARQAEEWWRQYSRAALRLSDNDVRMLAQQFQVRAATFDKFIEQMVRVVKRAPGVTLRPVEEFVNALEGVTRRVEEAYATMPPPAPPVTRDPTPPTPPVTVTPPTGGGDGMNRTGYGTGGIGPSGYGTGTTGTPHKINDPSGGVAGGGTTPGGVGISPRPGGGGAAPLRVEAMFERWNSELKDLTYEERRALLELVKRRWQP